MDWHEWQTKHHYPLFDLTAEQMLVAEKILDRLALKLQEEQDWYCWEEEDYMENKLFYEYDLEHLEELNKRERHPSKEKHR